MKKVFNSILVVSMGLILVNCDDVFEENITNDLMTVVTPKNGEKIVGNSVVFKWNSIDGADDYRIQVLKSNSEEVIIDSLFFNNSLTLPMDTGEYDWRIRGENFAYQTAYSFPESFSVESTNDLSSQNVFLNSPSENFYSKNNTIILNWSELAAATSYTLQIEKTVSNNTSIIFQEADIISNGYSLDDTILSEDAIYRWGVRAVNEDSQTGLTTRTIFLDTNRPTQPVLTSPNDNETVSTTVDFSWGLGQDSGEVQSPLSSILEISDDQNYTSIIQSYTVDGATQQHIFTSVGQYYWRVKIVDAAGNESDFSESRLLTVE